MDFFSMKTDREDNSFLRSVNMDTLQNSLIEPEKNIGSSVGFTHRKNEGDDEFERIMEDSDINLAMFSPVQSKLPEEMKNQQRGAF